jgi:hypothetical protein
MSLTRARRIQPRLKASLMRAWFRVCEKLWKIPPSPVLSSMPQELYLAGGGSVFDERGGGC